MDVRSSAASRVVAYLPSRRGPAVGLAGDRDQLVDVGLGLRGRADALLLDDEDPDGIAACAASAVEGETRSCSGEAEGTRNA
jgi:hypothetical protein